MSLGVLARWAPLGAVVLLLAAGPAFSAGAAGPDAFAVSVARSGAAATLAALDRAGQLDGFLDRIESGQRAWVAPSRGGSAPTSQ